MNMNPQQSLELEQTMEACRESIAFGDALARLESNRNFDKLITKYYLSEYAAQQVGLLAHPNFAEGAAKNEVYMNLEGISRFRQFCIMIHQQAEMARSTMADCKEYVERVESEGDEE